MRPSGMLQAIVFVVPLLLLALLAASPLLLWQLRPITHADVLIFDSTVPGEGEVREHAGLVWILNHRRIMDPDNDGPFSSLEDYAGYHPDRPDGSRSDRVLPPPDSLDLAYLADSYGVYADRDQRGSRLVAGGITVEEAEAIGAAVRPGGLVVAEFNTLADPTGAEARAVLEELLGVRWTGWVGRWFTDLGSSSEVPVWMRETHVDAVGEPWAYGGPGLVLVGPGSELVVLVDGEDVDGPPSVRPEASLREEFGLPGEAAYGYWFDVVEPARDAHVPAEYHLDLRPDGRAALEQAGVPASFPAIVTRSDERTTWYFAGDWADLETATDSRYGAAGLTWWHRTQASGSESREEQFFWSFYEPLVTGVLASGLER